MSWPEHPVTVRVGDESPGAVRAALVAAGVRTNAHADRLLDEESLWSRAPEEVTVVVRSLADLGLDQGAGVFEVFDAARDRGLDLCPPDAAPHLRLAWGDQPDAPDTVLSAGRPPLGAITVAARPLQRDDGFPKGFYLRRVDGVPWLRGYRCDADYLHPPWVRFAFRRP